MSGKQQCSLPPSVLSFDQKYHAEKPDVAKYRIGGAMESALMRNEHIGQEWISDSRPVSRSGQRREV